MLHTLTNTGRRYVQLHWLSYRTCVHAVGRHSLPIAIMPQLLLHFSMPCLIP